MNYDFHIFILLTNSVFRTNLWKYFVASWAMGNLIYLESGRSVKFIKIKGPRETQGPGFDEKFLPGGRNLTKLENLRQGYGGCNAWKMRHACTLLGLLSLP